MKATRYTEEKIIGVLREAAQACGELTPAHAIEELKKIHRPLGE